MNTRLSLTISLAGGNIMPVENYCLRKLSKSENCSERLNREAGFFAIDSMPLEICKISREQRKRMGKKSAHQCSDKGYYESQKKYFYGYKLHSVCSAGGVVQSLDLTIARVHDVHYHKYVKELFRHCIITGYKEYMGRPPHKNLFETAGIQLEVPLRSNQKEKRPVISILKKVRKRIETVFLQLYD